MIACKRCFTVLLALVICHCFLSTPCAESLERKVVKKTDFGKVETDKWEKDSVAFSADGFHVAFVVRDNMKFRVQRDGKKGEAYDKVFGNKVWFSPDSKRCGYFACKGEQWYSVIDGNEQAFPGYPMFGTKLLWSNDSKRWVFKTQVDDGKVLICDGKVEGAYKDVTDVMFSNDSKKLGFRAEIGGSPWVEVVVVDGKKGPEWAKVIPGTFRFCPRSKKHAYIAREEEKHGVIVNHKLQGRTWYDGYNKDMLKFSPDGRKLYAVMIDGCEFERLLINGKQFKGKLSEYQDLRFSTDGKKVAWIASAGGKWHVFLKSKLYASYESKFSAKLILSPDGKTVVFPAATADKKMFYSINKEDEKKYPGMAGCFKFSPDSKHYAYLAKADDDKWIIVRDGQETCTVKDIRPSTLCYCPNSMHLAVCASSAANQWFVVLDGKRGKVFEKVFGDTLRFSPDGRHHLFMAKTDEGWTLVIDEKEGPVFEYCWTRKIHFTSATRCHYIMVHDSRIYLVEEELPEK